MNDLAIHLTIRAVTRDEEHAMTAEDQPRAALGEAERLPLTALDFRITDLQQWIDLCA